MTILKRIIFTLVLILIFSELLLRLLGFKTFEPFLLKLEDIQPANSMKTDSLLGFSLKPGTYTYIYEKDYSFVATHNDFGYRICSDSICPDSINKINFYGGSLFYGFGLNDSLSFPWKFQKKIEGFKVNNFAIFGHSPVTTLLQIKQQIKDYKKPKYAVITYASYNADRTSFLYSFKRNLYANKKHINDNTLSYNYAKYIDDKIVLKKDKFYYKPLMFSTKSVTANLLNNVIEKYYDNKIDKEKVHLNIMIEIVNLCLDNSIKPVIFSVSNNEITINHLEKLKSLGANVIVSKVDFNMKKFNLLPFDNHPNSEATSLYTEELFNFMKKK